MLEILTFNEVKIALSVSVFPKRMFYQSEMQSSNIWTISRAHPTCDGSKIFCIPNKNRWINNEPLLDLWNRETLFMHRLWKKSERYRKDCPNRPGKLSKIRKQKLKSKIKRNKSQLCQIWFSETVVIFWTWKFWDYAEKMLDKQIRLKGSATFKGTSQYGKHRLGPCIFKIISKRLKIKISYWSNLIRW